MTDRQRPHRMRLSGAVQDVAEQAAGEHPVDRFGHRPHRTGQPQSPGDDVGQLERGGGHQPDLLTGVEVCHRQRAGAGPDLVGEDLVVDLLAQHAQLGRGAALDEGQRLAPALGDVGAVLPARHLEFGLCVHELPDLAVPEVLAGSQAATEVHQRRALHEGVVDIEEGRGGQVGRFAVIVTLAHAGKPIQ